MGCWVALDRAISLTELGEMDSGHADRWRAERAEIHDWVNQHCWSEHKRSYTFYAGTDELDAATLLAARTGFDRGERLAGTIDAVRAELGCGALVYRYSGMDQEEGAFLACTYWLVEALAVAGRRKEAAALMEQAVALVNDVGLLAEQMDPRTGEMLGNLPQGLSHLALINAAVTLHRRSGTPAEPTVRTYLEGRNDRATRRGGDRRQRRRRPGSGSGARQAGLERRGSCPR
jgi:GH15 family glucan-1,4-alpha-glucosidase